MKCMRRVMHHSARPRLPLMPREERRASRSSSSCLSYATYLRRDGRAAGAAASRNVASGFNAAGQGQGPRALAPSACPGNNRCRLRLRPPPPLPLKMPPSLRLPSPCAPQVVLLDRRHALERVLKVLAALHDGADLGAGEVAARLQCLQLRHHLLQQVPGTGQRAGRGAEDWCTTAGRAGSRVPSTLPPPPRHTAPDCVRHGAPAD